ncbi:hypothetical protein N781_12950 [Pontibacillus halophilus JSM 076056 = DSM 19796]|uniref:Peptidyl-prolyl cis-trans isomerase n=1 Tax=Pontibacillus halophilus JSM 076056 = DSM 19796 TaxID=1385510 RepID=A0A0A5IBT6_9BACI|nr:hypothetical protein [Pontibacillus halophilus]KGX93307.1 hypothetical protein N781_12950 [Pontibacillus halophilus JSM 076056 = DSM 19796]
MIIQLTGLVQYPITLDPSVWIFDDRKIHFDKAFTDRQTASIDENEDVKKAAQFWDREVYQQKLDPPVNKSISSLQKREILEGTYVMPIRPFIQNAEVQESARFAKIHTDEDTMEVNLPQLQDALFLFAQNGKQLKEGGPVHIYFADGSNKDEPITHVRKIEFL